MEKKTADIMNTKDYKKVKKLEDKLQVLKGKNGNDRQRAIIHNVKVGLKIYKIVGRDKIQNARNKIIKNDMNSTKRALGTSSQKKLIKALEKIKHNNQN